MYKHTYFVIGFLKNGCWYNRVSTMNNNNNKNNIFSQFFINLATINFIT